MTRGAYSVRGRTWALDFMRETLYDGRRVRLLTVIDEGNREGLEIAMGLSGAEPAGRPGAQRTCGRRRRPSALIIFENTFSTSSP